MAKKKTVKQRIEETLLHNLPNLAPTDSNIGQYLFDVYYWQEIQAIADFHLKKAWAAAQSKDGPIKEDDLLRAMGRGEHIIADSDRFSCLATVQEPRMCFDRVCFKQNIAKKYKIAMVDLDKQEELARLPSKPPLQKRVVEA